MTIASGSPIEVLCLGRIGVDLYPLQVGVGLEDVQTFAKFLGGSATNVAVAAARHGRRTALLTRVGDDPFGRFALRSLAELGVDTRLVGTVPGSRTPVAFCELFPPDDFPLWFYREGAPDLRIAAEQLDLPSVRAAGVFWTTGTGLSVEPSRGAHLAALVARGRAGHTVLDLDYRPSAWASPEAARRSIRSVLELVTVAVGNREECEVAVGQRDPEAAAMALLDHGVELAVVKMGPDGVLAMTRDERVVVPPIPVRRRERPRRRGRLRWGAVPRLAGGMGPRRGRAVRQRCRRPGGHPAGVRDGDADIAGGRRLHAGGKPCLNSTSPPFGSSELGSRRRSQRLQLRDSGGHSSTSPGGSC